MEKHFVTYEIAKELKELGFNEKCFGFFSYKEFMFWTKNSGVEYDHCRNEYFNNIEISVPIWSQAIDFLEEVGLSINYHYDKLKKEFKYDIVYLANNKKFSFYEVKVLKKSKIKGLEEMILHAIKILKDNNVNFSEKL